MAQSFVGDMWSETAAILGYSGAGQTVALPALLTTLEMTKPYACTASPFECGRIECSALTHTSAEVISCQKKVSISL